MSSGASPLPVARPSDLRVLPRGFYEEDPCVVAPLLLNKVLVRGGASGRVVEVEAYAGSRDPASHAFRGLTARNATMFGPAGHLYVYFSYGMHWCANVVCGTAGHGVAVLFRALAPMSGIEQMRRARRGARSDRELCSGPAKLCQALGISGSLDGADLVDAAGGVWLADDGTPPPEAPGRGPRIGISVATERPWRWWVEGDPNVSRVPRREPRSGATRRNGQ